MRPIETALLIALFLVLLLRFVEGVRGALPAGRRPIALLLLAFLGAHLILEGPRWQFIPAYALLVWLVLRAFFTHPEPTLRTSARLWRGLTAAGALAIVAVNAALGVALPIPTLPEPGGPYAIGTAVFTLEQPDRPDPYGKSGETRRFPVQVWYPASDTEGAERVPWNGQGDAFVRAAARSVRIPYARVFFSHLGYALSHSYLDTSPTTEGAPFPVVVYSHGWTGWRTVAIDQIERLASRGFIVIAPDHTYGALASVFPDAEAIPSNPAAMPPKEPRDAWQTGVELLVDTYAKDIEHILDVLPDVNTGKIPTPVAGLLDLKRIGIFGHSTGGGAVTEIATLDDRVDCCLALDPWVEPVSSDVMAKPLRVPYMSIRSAEWHDRAGDDNNRKLARILGKAQGPIWDLYLEGTEHTDFTVAPLLFPYAHTLGFSASKAGRRELQVTEDYIEGFFTRYLKREDVPWLDGPSATYPEMVFVSTKETPAD